MEERMRAADMFDVTGYVAIVTGGASGIGLSFVEVLAEHGARVTIIDRNSEGVEKEVARLRAAEYDVRGQVIDVTDRQALDRTFDDTATEYGRLDVVFANAGIDPGIGFVSMDRSKRLAAGAIENYESDRWNKVIELNLNSVFTTISAAARHMKPNNAGSIIVTTSIAAFLLEPAIGAAYMAAKAGAAHLMRNAALELARYNIRVNAIAPGFFLTNIGDGWMKDPSAVAPVAKAVPIGRVGNTEELKGLALYLASPASRYMTGSQLNIDGGLSIGTAM
jgi:NAD(P)-dependent dehydrogenase (short-subunit alcohol dehydrogenase family)